MNTNVHITRYEELPNIPLLLDQVLLVANRAVKGLVAPAEKDGADAEHAFCLTSAMVNNYVKRGLVPAPAKRRYTRDQVCRLIWICLLKQVMGLDDVGAFFAAVESRGELGKAYDAFCDDVEALLGLLDAPELPVDELVLSAAQAVASRLRLLDLLHEERRLEEAEEEPLLHSGKSAAKEPASDKKPKERAKAGKKKSRAMKQ